MEHYLPTITSPKSYSHKNLTGNSRILKDLAADIHNNIHQWNSIHLNGLSIIKSITAIKNDNLYSSNLQNLCDELEKKIDQLDVIVNNIKFTVNRIKALTSLHKVNDKLFITWPPERFNEYADEILKGYSDEAELKRKIMENVAHNYDDSCKMLHLASWAYQPMIPHKLDSIVEALLNETGHR